MLGIDIVDIERIKKIYRKHGLLFLEKILDNQEIASLPAQQNKQFFKQLAYYIASKEAIFKACSGQNLDWQEIAIRNITVTPQIYIKRPGFAKKVSLSFADSKDVVLSQALVV